MPPPISIHIQAAPPAPPAAPPTPPPVHLHTEDRPNKVINQRPIFKWFAGRLKPLHTLPRVNSATDSDTHSHQRTGGTASTGHLHINIYIRLHCIAEGATTSIYQYTYAYISYALGKLTASVIRLRFGGTRRSLLILKRGGQFEYCT